VFFAFKYGTETRSFKVAWDITTGKPTIVKAQAINWALEYLSLYVVYNHARLYTEGAGFDTEVADSETEHESEKDSWKITKPKLATMAKELNVYGTTDSQEFGSIDYVPDTEVADSETEHESEKDSWKITKSKLATMAKELNVYGTTDSQEFGSIDYVLDTMMREIQELLEKYPHQMSPTGGFGDSTRFKEAVKSYMFPDDS
jgi:hypothetical protein